MIDPHPWAYSRRLMVYKIHDYAFSISRHQNYIICNLGSTLQTPLYLFARHIFQFVSKIPVVTTHVFLNNIFRFIMSFCIRLLAF